MYKDKNKAKETEKARLDSLYKTKFLPTFLAFIALYPFHLENLQGELWRWVVGYEGLYQISNFGRVKSFQNGILKILKPALSKHGYPFATLSKNGKSKIFKIHRLVALTFIPNPMNLPEVNHKFGNKLDCYYENLEWVTSAENIRHALKTGLQTSPKLNKEQVKYIREVYIPADSEYGARALARKFNVDSSTVISILHGKSYKYID